MSGLTKEQRRQLKEAGRLATVDAVDVYRTLYGAPSEDCPYCGEPSRTSKCPHCGFVKDSERITGKTEAEDR